MARLACLCCAALLALAGCGSGQLTAVGGIVKSPVSRANPAVPAGDGAALQAGGSLFAGRLLNTLSASSSGNVVVSPFSISEALAMTLAGARGETARQIAAALNFELSGSRLHGALDALDSSLAEIPGLSIASALYGQQHYAFRSAFLDLLARYYGAAMHTVDFEHATEQARSEINRWVSEHTHAKIPELLARGVLDTLTRLVLVNAVYLKATWKMPFATGETAPAPFYGPSGRVMVPTMSATQSFGYARRAGYQAVELPYAGDRLALDVLLPDPGRLAWLESRMAASGPLKLLEALHPTDMLLQLPRLTLRTHADLKPVLSALGMPNAFDPARADLSGIAGPPGELYLKTVVHEAYVRVDEHGTEAAAATAAIAVATSAQALPPLRVYVDRPFLFVLRDRVTGAVLFAGVVRRPLG